MKFGPVAIKTVKIPTGRSQNGRHLIGNPGNPLFCKGNQLLKKENLPPESHARRMAALFRTWSVQAKKRQGKRVMTTETKEKIRKTKRNNRIETTAKEAREIQDLARRNAVAAMEALIDIVNDDEGTATSRISAAAVILDRAYGKPNQTNLNATLDGKKAEVTQSELDKRIADVLKRIDALTGSTGTSDTTDGETSPSPSPERSADLRKLN